MVSRAAPWHRGTNLRPATCANRTALAELEFLMTVTPTGSALLVSLLAAAALAAWLSALPCSQAADRKVRRLTGLGTVTAARPLP